MATSVGRIMTTFPFWRKRLPAESAGILRPTLDLRSPRVPRFPAERRLTVEIERSGCAMIGQLGLQKFCRMAISVGTVRCFGWVSSTIGFERSRGALRWDKEGSMIWINCLVLGRATPRRLPPHRRSRIAVAQFHGPNRIYYFSAPWILLNGGNWCLPSISNDPFGQRYRNYAIAAHFFFAASLGTAGADQRNLFDRSPRFLNDICDRSQNSRGNRISFFS